MSNGVPKRWYRKLKYQILVAALIILLVVSFLPTLQAPLPANQVRLNRAVDYFANTYDAKVGLIAETPGSQRFWLYSDNYLSALALGRYSSGNQSTSGFASAIDAAVVGYGSTLPAGLLTNQYTALNSTTASFDCSANYAISWASGGALVPGNGSAAVMTTSNDKGPSCGSQNYADLLLLQAVYNHRLGNNTAALSYYQMAAKEFDGTGFVDLTNSGQAGTRVYQTYKVALYVYATYCLSQQASASNLATAERTMLYMQSNSTGGFATTYEGNLTSLSAPGVTASSGANTETTALAALAIELMINPSSSC